MRCISLWQPWASLLVLGTKTIETRHWPTSYRGPLLIHAAKRFVAKELNELDSYSNFRAGLHAIGSPHLQKLPFGAIVGQVEMVDCKLASSFSAEELDRLKYVPGHDGDDMHAWNEEGFGNFAPGRFGWVMANPKMFETPIPYKGSQGFFEVNPSDLQAVLESINGAL